MIILHVQQWRRLLQLFRKLRGLIGQDTRPFDVREIAVRTSVWFMHKSRTQKH